MKYIAVSKDKVALKQLQNDETFRSVDVDTVRLLNACTSSNITIKEGDEKMDMCIGMKEWIEEERAEAEENKLMELVQKKIAKQCSIDEIADALEESVEKIQEIIEKIQ